MKHQIRFESDPALDRIEIVVRAPQEDEEVLSLLKRLTEASEGLTFMDTEGKAHVLTPDRVIALSVEDKVVRVVTEDGSWHTRRTLQSLETALSGHRFIRISRHELVNLDKVIRYSFTLAGSLRLELAGGREAWASRRCIPDIRRRLQGKE